MPDFHFYFLRAHLVRRYFCSLVHLIDCRCRVRCLFYRCCLFHISSYFLRRIFRKVLLKSRWRIDYFLTWTIVSKIRTNSTGIDGPYSSLIESMPFCIFSSATSCAQNFAGFLYSSCFSLRITMDGRSLTNFESIGQLFHAAFSVKVSSSSSIA